MRNILVEITCPACGFHKHVKSHTLVLPELEPELRKRILSHTLFSYHCPVCKQEIIFLHSFIYHDKAHRFLLYMGEDVSCIEDFKKQFPDTLLRHVHTPSQLAEKLRILEDGLDDRVLCFLTLFLKRKYPRVKKIQYHDKDEATQSIWFTFLHEDCEELKGIDFDTYTLYQKRYSSSYLPSYKIDEEWAAQCLQNN